VAATSGRYRLPTSPTPLRQGRTGLTALCLRRRVGCRRGAPRDRTTRPN